MGFAAYQYRSDDGNTYQVLLDDLVATQLGYVPATGSEPYLPPFISYRYANYQALPSEAYIQAVITRPFDATTPPTSITVGSVSYKLRSARGESRSGGMPSNVMVIAGPQGPPGVPGPQALTYVTTEQATDNVVLTDPQNVLPLTLTPGIWLVIATVEIANVAGVYPYLSVQVRNPYQSTQVAMCVPVIPLGGQAEVALSAVWDTRLYATEMVVTLSNCLGYHLRGNGTGNGDHGGTRVTAVRLAAF